MIKNFENILEILANKESYFDVNYAMNIKNIL
jgi:hypothetical protein